MQMYVIIPMALALLRPRETGFRGRLQGACGLTMLASIAYQCWMVVTHRISLPLPLFAIWDAGASAGHSLEASRMAWAFYKNIYASLPARAADVAGGILAYELATNLGVCQCMRAQPRRCTIAACVAFVGSAVQIFSGIAALKPEADPDMPLSIRLAGLVGIMAVWALAASTWLLLYIIVQPDQPSRYAASFLSAEFWQPIDARSYSVSLLHWPILLMVFRCIPVASTIGSLLSFKTFCVVYCLVVCLSMGAATAQDRVLDWIIGRLQGTSANLRAKGPQPTFAAGVCKQIPTITLEMGLNEAGALKVFCQSDLIEFECFC